MLCCNNFKLFLEDKKTFSKIQLFNDKIINIRIIYLIKNWTFDKNNTIAVISYDNFYKVFKFILYSCRAHNKCTRLRDYIIQLYTRRRHHRRRRRRHHRHLSKRIVYMMLRGLSVNKNIYTEFLFLYSSDISERCRRCIW